MDQLKAFLSATVKHIFWVICGTVVALSIGSWYMACGNLDKEFQTHVSTIEKNYTTVKTIKDKTIHPNEFSQKGMDQLNKGLLDSVLNAWQAQYSQQTSILRWSGDLGDDFVASVRLLIPIELKVEFDATKNPPTPLSQELKVDFRQRYANYVEKLLPELAEMIGAKWAAKAGVTGMGSGMSEMSMSEMPTSPTAGANRPKRDEKPPIVLWSPADQGQLLGDHFNWSKQPDSVPTTLQLLYAQEDLWVLKALMSIVKEVNKDADSRHEAVVKTIESVLIGRQASGRAGQVTRMRGGTGGSGTEGGYAGSESGGPAGSMGSGAGGSAPGGGGPAPGGGGAAPGGYPGPGGSGSMSPGMEGMPGMPGMPGMARGATDPADYRYVGMEYSAMPAEKVRSAMKSEKPEDAFYVVAKRMPIRLRLVVDQRRLYRLLTECGNCSLPVEIRQVRINRKGGSSGGGMDLGGGSNYAMPGSGGEMSGGPGQSDFGMSPGTSPSGYEAGSAGMGMGMGSGPGMGTADMTKRSQVSSASDYDVTVELQGIIYIYNPVDKSRLGLQDVPVTTSIPPLTTKTQG
ncbi:MAG: hypothetical protein NTY19_40500 [Planctomycetota bacterium]|nr:hypothetical protein [Planctomycetota bacterium]